MHVIGHEAVGLDVQAEHRRLVAKDDKVGAEVVLDEEDGLSLVAGLGDMMRRIRNDRGMAVIYAARRRPASRKQEPSPFS